ncbi:MAG TPA: molybdenum cofactor guanylyltransferase [Candidatus Binataceae bacterium]|nr:molybdenum cofactor guanylyltransferase [Candidatus Binataceae bacterium]
MDDRRESTIVGSASAIILAGGRGARMGQPKATLRFGEVTLIERTVSELARAFDDIVVVAAPESEAIELPPLGAATIVHDDDAYQGPVGALARGLRAARHELAFACSCDLPMLRAEVAVWMLSLVGEFDAVLPQVDGRLQPLHAAYRRRCAGALDAMLARGEHRLSAVADAMSARIVPDAEYRRADPDALSCLNINTPEDYVRAMKRRLSS